MSLQPRTRAQLASLIDHTLLKPQATAAEIDQLCDECLQYGFFAACVQPVWVERCVRRLGAGRSALRTDIAGGTGAMGSIGVSPASSTGLQRADRPIVCTVVGFPHGAALTETKALEARRAIEQGALEVDMVIYLAALINGQYDLVTRDIAAVVEAARRVNPAARLKVILETRALTDERISAGCRCAADGGADFVKTSTGFHPAGGATVEHVALLRRCADALAAQPPPAVPIASPPSQGDDRREAQNMRPRPRLKVKAAGGIRDLQTALAMLEAGADRLGTSSSVAVLTTLAEAADKP